MHESSEPLESNLLRVLCAREMANGDFKTRGLTLSGLISPATLPESLSSVLSSQLDSDAVFE